MCDAGGLQFLRYGRSSQSQNSRTGSPEAGVERALSTSRDVDSETNRTEPSASSMWQPLEKGEPKLFGP